ncbi:CpsD/CapB family tyrosine-protein kinase [Yoonia sp. 2307UL14-13]|uniref:CpsD/CapB family tyrosine-protein kinase n=1 Tax=Yoonia sp. 2307UL14-13 TaxID=3126506 RepID=UPI0030AE5E08
MDHIRSAIEEARKQRAENKRRRDNNIGPDEPPGPDQLKFAQEQLWQKLPEFKTKPGRLLRNRVMTIEANKAAAPYDVMRTNLLHEMRSKNWRRVAITSPGGQCGKTTVGLNLAFSLARQRDIRVMVVELDLRQPAIARILGIRPTTDFADVLAVQTKVGDSIQRMGDNLAFAVPKKVRQNAAELLQSVHAAHVIDAIEKRYQPDVMIFDMPPMLVTDDTLAFSDQLDCALLVGAAETTSIDEIARCKQGLEDRTNLIGVILNKCRYMDGAEGYAAD